MRQPLLSLCILTAVALSSSNIILDRVDTTRRLFRGQENDNISNNRGILDKIICDDKEISSNDDGTFSLCKVLKLKNYINTDYNGNRENSLKYIVDKRESNYNGKGYRKEQWHNYPRQLDRLQRFLYERRKSDYTNEEGIDEPDPQILGESIFDETIPQYDDNLHEIRTNEILIHDNEDAQHVYDTVVASTNPLLILKIRLACLSNTLTNDNNERLHLQSRNPDSESNIEDRKDINENIMPSVENQINPKISIFEDRRYLTDSLENVNSLDYPISDVQVQANQFKGVPTKKRIFSLWSRLQSLSPTGHELHHRRHLHTFYGLPGGDGGGGIVSAETRAFVRPPGSPLRWG